MFLRNVKTEVLLVGCSFTCQSSKSPFVWVAWKAHACVKLLTGVLEVSVKTEHEGSMFVSCIVAWTSKSGLCLRRSFANGTTKVHIHLRNCRFHIELQGIQPNSVLKSTVTVVISFEKLDLWTFWLWHDYEMIRWWL